MGIFILNEGTSQFRYKDRNVTEKRRLRKKNPKLHYSLSIYNNLSFSLSPIPASTNQQTKPTKNIFKTKMKIILIKLKNKVLPLAVCLSFEGLDLQGRENLALVGSALSLLPHSLG